MNRRKLILLVVGLLALAGVLFTLTRVSLSALDEPGAVETYLATQFKRWSIGRAAAGPLPPEPPNNQASLNVGATHYRAQCASCHGSDGRTPSEIGRAMYPRVPDLGSDAVQGWSDAELFWITRHGIRLTGMPGFADIFTDKEIWHIVHHVRTLPPPSE